MLQNAGSTFPANRKSNATAKDSTIIAASTSIAAPRLNAGGDCRKARCAHPAGRLNLPPIICMNHIAVHSNFYGSMYTVLRELVSTLRPAGFAFSTLRPYKASLLSFSAFLFALREADKPPGEA